MRHTINKLIQLFGRLLYPALCVLVFILILKQLNVYDRIITLYHALLPVFGGAVIAFLLQPIIDKVSVHFSRKMAVTIVYFGLLISCILLSILLLPLIYKQCMDFAAVLPVWISKIEKLLNEYQISIDLLSDYKNSMMQEGYSIVLTSLKSFVDTISSYAVSFLTAFFISADLEFWLRSCRRVMPDMQHVITFYKTMSNIIYQYLTGTFLDMAFIVITTFLILFLSGFPNAILYACLLALLNLFPYIGPTIGLLVVVIVGVLSYETPPYLTLFLIWSIQQLESNLIQPMIFNKTMNVRPILTFVALFICDALFGIPGVILSPIFAAVVQITFRSYLHAKSNDTVGEWEDIWYDFDEAMAASKFDT